MSILNGLEDFFLFKMTPKMSMVLPNLDFFAILGIIKTIHALLCAWENDMKTAK